MTDFIEELFFSDISGTGRCHAASSLKQKCLSEQDKIYSELKEKLSKEDFKAFEEYTRNEMMIEREDLCNAFADGIKFAFELFTGVYSE